ncbi:hypothetical protein Goshw_024388 [Gossypium schwendimanii]|uniref:DUF7745 domain-containing protein n=2 Tax=Gossypium schwendimanii TaxID=34291 RepID=A0A7J9NDE8_GOSSC|nr:hypothetical protein [Gossypium schwendimanii]
MAALSPVAGDRSYGRTKYLDRKLIMEKGFLDKVEYNAAVRMWAESMRVKVDKYLFRALAQFWNPAYSCFTFGKVYLAPTVEEYTTLLQCPKIQVDKAYSRASLRNLVLVHPDVKKRVYVFALAVMPIPAILAKTFKSLNACRIGREERAPWLIPDEILYRYGDFDRVPLLGIWGAEDNYKKKVREMSNAWNQTRRMKILAVGPSMTSKYRHWCDQRVNNNIPVSNPETTRSLEEHLQNKAEEDLDSLKTDYKKLRRSMRTTGLGKMSEQWRQEIQAEKIKVDQWEKKFQNTRAREVALEKSLLVCQNEKTELKVQVTELERSLHQHRSRNSAIELKASLGKIEDLKGQVRELEDALQNSGLQTELLERINEQWQEQFHRSQDQIRERDYIMGEAMAQLREVANHLQTLAV